MSGGPGNVRNLQDGDGRPINGAEIGNVRAFRSGFYSLAEIERNPRTAAIAAEIESVLPISAPGDIFGVWVLAGCIERRLRGLADLESGTKSVKETAILRRDLNTVENTIGRLLDALGLTPRSRAALGLDLSRTGEELRKHLTDNYGDKP